jgi:hypothetical protein
VERERALRQDGKVFDTFAVVKTMEGLHPAYRWEYAEGTRQPNGHLVVFRLLPDDCSLPTFEGRWDEGETALDIDIVPNTASKSQIWRFKNGVLGCGGHHPDKIDALEGHEYKVEIVFASSTIFVGTVSFALGRRLAISTSTSVRTSVGKEVGRPISVTTPVAASVSMRVIRAPKT